MRRAVKRWGAPVNYGSRRKTMRASVNSGASHSLRRLAVKLWEPLLFCGARWKFIWGLTKPARARGLDPKRKKEEVCRARPLRLHKQDLSALSGGGRWRRLRRDRDGRLLLGLAAAERLQPELGQLLGPGAEVLPDALAQHGGQQLHVAHRALELDRKLLLRRGQGRLLLGQILRPSQALPEAAAARLEVGDLADGRLHRRVETLGFPQNRGIGGLPCHWSLLRTGACRPRISQAPELAAESCSMCIESKHVSMVSRGIEA